MITEKWTPTGISCLLVTTVTIFYHTKHYFGPSNNPATIALHVWDTILAHRIQSQVIIVKGLMCLCIWI